MSTFYHTTQVNKINLPTYHTTKFFIGRALRKYILLGSIGKTYDRVEWVFLDKIIERLSFHLLGASGFGSALVRSNTLLALLAVCLNVSILNGDYSQAILFHLICFYYEPRD